MEQPNHIEGFEWDDGKSVGHLVKPETQADNSKPDSGKKIIVESLEADFYDEDKNELGLKFSRLKQRTAKTMRLLCPQDLDNLDCYPLGESPSVMDVKVRLDKIKEKYDGSLQKIEEDAHEMSLAQSRNSMVLRNSSKEGIKSVGVGKSSFATAEKLTSGKKRISKNEKKSDCLDFENKENVSVGLNRTRTNPFFYSEVPKKQINVPKEIKNDTLVSLPKKRNI